VLILENRMNTGVARGDLQICVLSRFLEGVLVFVPVKLRKN